MLKKRGVRANVLSFYGMGPLECYMKSIDIIYIHVYTYYIIGIGPYQQRGP